METYLNNYIVAAAPTTTVVATGPTVLHSIVINKCAANAVITIYDGVTAGGTVKAIITMPATLLASQATMIYDTVFLKGICIVTSVAAQDVTVMFKPAI